MGYRQTFTICIDNCFRCFSSLPVGSSISFFSEKGSAGAIRRTSKNSFLICFISFSHCICITCSCLKDSIKKLEFYFKYF